MEENQLVHSENDLPRAPRQAKWILLAICLFVLGFGASLFWLTRLRVKEQTWTLPDGSSLRLVNVTWGTNHICRFGNSPMDFFYPLIPAKWRTNFTFHVARTTMPDPGGMVLWLERTLPSTNAAYPIRVGPVAGGASSVSSSDWKSSGSNFSSMQFVSSGSSLQGRPLFLAAIIADGSGVESPQSRAMSPIWRAKDGLKELIVCQMRSYPRRDPIIKVKLILTSTFPQTMQVRNIGVMAAGAPLRVADFGVPHRGGRNAPVWKAETYPAVRLTNNLEVSLLQLQTGLTYDQAYGPRLPQLAQQILPGQRGLPVFLRGEESNRCYSCATLQVRERGVLSSNWSVSYVVFSNAFGDVIYQNSTAPVSFSSGFVSSPGFAQFGSSATSMSVGAAGVNRNATNNSFPLPGALWLSEPAWKLSAELTHIAGFGADELWTITGLPVLTGGQSTNPSLVTIKNGVDLKLVEIGDSQGSSGAFASARSQSSWGTGGISGFGGGGGSMGNSATTPQLNLTFQVPTSLRLSVEVKDDAGHTWRPSGRGNSSGSQMFMFDGVPGSKTVDVILTGNAVSPPPSGSSGGSGPGKITLAGIPIPAVDQIIETNVQSNISGGLVRLTRIAVSQGSPVGPNVFPSGARFSSIGRFGVTVELPLSQNISVVDLKDDLGRAWQSTGGGMHSFAGSNGVQVCQRQFSFTPLDGAKTVDVTFAVGRSVSVDFLVRPELGSTNANTVR